LYFSFTCGEIGQDKTTINYMNNEPKRRTKDEATYDCVCCSLLEEFVSSLAVSDIFWKRVGVLLPVELNPKPNLQKFWQDMRGFG
jgi:hypothetical protein